MVAVIVVVSLLTNNQAIALEIIKAIIFVVLGGLGGWGYANHKANTANSNTVN